MAEFTPTWGLPYPVLSAPNNPPADLKALAEALDAALSVARPARYAITVPQGTTIAAGSYWQGTVTFPTPYLSVPFAMSEFTASPGGSVPLTSRAQPSTTGVTARVFNVSSASVTLTSPLGVLLLVWVSD